MTRARGSCVHCGCTGKNPCHLGRFVKCSLIYTNPRLVCSNRECVQKEVNLLFADIEEKQRNAERALCP